MLKNSKVFVFLSPYKVGQAGNFWTLLRIMITLSQVPPEKKQGYDSQMEGVFPFILPLGVIN
jgi:hypothetical protein